MESSEEKSNVEKELLDEFKKLTDAVTENADFRKHLHKKEDGLIEKSREENLRINAMSVTASLYRKLAETSVDIDKVIADADKVFKYFINEKS